MNFLTGNFVKAGKTALAVQHPEACNIAKTVVNTNYAKTSIISGTQWDVVMRFVNGKSDGTGSPFYAMTWKSVRHVYYSKTGSVASDRVCNIFDLEGSGREWTSEEVTGGVVFRGGDANNSIGNLPARIKS